MKVVIGDSFISVKDVNYAMIMPRQTNVGAAAKELVQFDLKWGILTRALYRAREWLCGPVTEEFLEEPKYEYQLVIDYIDEWDKSVRLNVTYNDYSNAKAVFDDMVRDFQSYFSRERCRRSTAQS